MKTQETTFERFEFKYWITHETAEALLRMTAPYLHCDDWAPGGQRNTSLYLDSPELEFARMHLESAPDRFKLRVRAYGDPPAGSAYFEIKRKVKAVIFKRRAVLPLEQLPRVFSSMPMPRLKSKEEEDTLSQFLYLQLVHRAEPKLLVSCRREAYTSHDKSEGVRLTLDRDLCYQPARGFSLEGDRRAWRRLCGVGSYQPGATTLVEVKFRGSAPIWLIEIVQRLGLNRCNFSKYVAAVGCEESGLEGLLASGLTAAHSVARGAKAA